MQRVVELLLQPAAVAVVRMNLIPQLKQVVLVVVVLIVQLERHQINPHFLELHHTETRVVEIQPIGRVTLLFRPGPKANRI